MREFPDMSFQVSWELNHIPQIHVLYSTYAKAKAEQDDRSFLKQFCCHIHSSWELVTLGIKNSLQPKQLSKCLPRRHPQKHYNLNKTYVLTLLSPVVTRLLSYTCSIVVLIGWIVGCSYRVSWYNVIYCRIIHKIAGDDKELKTKYYQLWGCTGSFGLSLVRGG